jgi:hypothetical protein
MPVLVGIAIIFGLHLYAHAQQLPQVRSLSADLTFNFYCKGVSSPELGEALEQFLKEKGFDVLNVSRLQRERGMIPGPLDLKMDAVDGEQRMISILSSGGFEPGWYALLLFSPPPTRRAEDLEKQILTFVSDKLGCPVHHVVRGENGPEASEYYKRILEKRLMRIREGNGEL